MRPILLPLIILVSSFGFACGSAAIDPDGGAGGGGFGGLGGNTGTGGHAGTGGGTADAGKPWYGSVSVSSAPGVGSGSAYFYEVTPGTGPGCTTTVLGACSFLQCESADAGTPASVVFRSAGVISVTGVLQPVSLSPFSDGGYSFYSGASSLYSGGEQLTISASGATVPPFSAQVVAPTQIQITSPSLPDAGVPLQLYRSQPLSFAWTGTSAGVLQVLVIKQGSPLQVLSCQFPASQTNATIPASALGHLASGQGHITTSLASTVQIEAGGWQVSLTASTIATAPGGAAWPATVVDIH